MSTSGWYNDEDDPTLARWFDGVGWTDHVTPKATWEAAGHPPPPPEELLAPVGPVRLRMVVATAAVLAVLVLGGVALARDGGGDGSGRTPTAGEPGAADVVGSTTGAGSGVVGATAPSDVADVSASTDDHAGTTRRTTVRGGTSRTTVRTSSAVQRTDTATHTHTDPGPVSEGGKGDKTSVGNTNDTTIKIGYVPPPPTTATSEPPTTVAETTTPPEDTSTTAP